MPFISDAEIEKENENKNKQEALLKKVQALKERETAKEQYEKEKPFSMNDWVKLANKASKPVRRNNDEEHNGEETEYGLSKQESNEIKDTIIKVLAIPQKDKKRNEMFQDELKQSHTVNSYIDSNIMYRILANCNDHLKFCAVYAIKYAHCNNVKISE